MKIKGIHSIKMRENLLYFKFDEERGVFLLKKIIESIPLSRKLYYYIMFGYSFHNYDLSVYSDKYPILCANVGFFQLHEQDVKNFEFIYQLLNQYHDCTLYINTECGLVDKYRNLDWRSIPYKDIEAKGYTINMFIHYLDIKKAPNLPDLDLSQIGVEV